MLQCAAFAGPAGPAFSFSAFPRFLSATSLQMETTPFFLTWRLPLPPDSSTTGSHWPNRGCLEVRWCVGPTHLLTSQKPPHRVEFGFAHQNELTPPPLGGRARYRLFGSLGFSRREARCFSAGKDGRFVSEGFSRQLPLATAAHNCPTRLQRGGEPASLVSFPTPPSKPHTGPHRAEFGFHRLFLPPFLIGSPASWRSKWQLTAS